MNNHEAITQAIQAMTPMVANETQAWNLWNSLNSSPAFIEAFQRMHGKLSLEARDAVEDAVWEELEEALEGPLHLDLNEVDESQEFKELVERVTKQVLFKLNGD